MSASQDPLVHDVLRRARRDRSMTQSALAEAVGCRQSAISMFEAGRADALAWNKIEGIAELLGVDLSPFTSVSARPGQTTATRLAYCPTPDCPSNVPYMAGGAACAKPRLVATREGGAAHCSLCGEVLETRCPNETCRSAVSAGAFCSFCGAAYISPLPAPPGFSAAWVEQQRRLIAELFALTESQDPHGGTPGLQASTRQSERQKNLVKGRQP